MLAIHSPYRYNEEGERQKERRLDKKFRHKTEDLDYLRVICKLAEKSYKDSKNGGD